MATLHDALQCLQPTTWNAVPQSPDELRDYLRDIFTKSRLIAESLPDPPPYDNDVHNYGESSSIRLAPSSARVRETDPEVTALQKQWGKPIKMGGAKDNPLGVHVWKLSANDGGGQWFGRRSVHEGMSFARWREKLSAEYDETLKVNRERIGKGQTPDKSIRGIGAEEKVETVEVKEEDGSVLGLVTVYHVSAQFPKPTAPRDFVAMIITSENGLRVGGTKQPGRSWIMISKPCEHPGVPQKNGYIRGEYESVEMIREIPRGAGTSSSGSSGRSGKSEGKTEEKKTGPDALAEGNKALDEEYDEMNPVEWIMVTRSDPGGNIPRWMVDKGTPKSVGADAAKFVNWAVQDEQPKVQMEESPNGSAVVMPSTQVKSAEEDSDRDEEDQSDSDSEYDSADSYQSHHGLIASVTGLLNTGLERFAPQAFRDYIPHQHEAHRSIPEGDQAPKDGINRTTTSTSNDIMQIPSSDYFTTREPDHTSLSSARSELATPTVENVSHNNLPPAELMAMTKTGKLSSREKELAKLALRKREIDAKLETVRSELDKLQLPSQSAPHTPLIGSNDGESENNSGVRRRKTDKRSSTPASSATKQSQRGGNSSDGQSSSNVRSQTQTPEQQSQPADVHKAASNLFRDEAKLLKQLRKIETNQLKVATKIEARQRKKTERSEKSKSKSEVESLRSEVKDLKKELGKLRAERQKWVDLVGSLQAENAKLAARQEQS